MVQTYFLYYVFYHFMYFGTSCGLKLIAVVISRMLESSAFIKTKFQQAFNFWQKVGAEVGFGVCWKDLMKEFNQTGEVCKNFGFP